MIRIRDGLKRLGDLPIFSTSINKIREISSNADSDAMAVANEVLKDANLSTKLLRLSNSASYNRGVGKIAVISRAVILLGFETIKNLALTLKLIETFQNASPNVAMGKMLVKAYLAAAFVRDMAEKCRVKDIEESYVCALLYNLGEIIVAYVLPDQYLRIQELIGKKGVGQAEAEESVLGTSIFRISQELATEWEFPATVVSTMTPPPSKIAGLAKDRTSFNRSVTALAHQLLNNLYSDSGDSDQFAGILEMLVKATGLSDGVVENYLNESFRLSCALATEYGLNKKLLKPQLGDGESTMRNKWARQFSYYASKDEDAPAASPAGQAVAGADSSSEITPAQPGRNVPAADAGSVSSLSSQGVSPMPVFSALEQIPPPSGRAAAAQGPSNPDLQLQIIQEITDLIARSARLNEVFVKVLDGLRRGVGFDRALLCLVTTDRRQYVGRLATGDTQDTLKKYFSFPINPASDLFSKILMEGGELMVNDAADSSWRNLLPSDFVETTKAKSFVIASLRYQERAVGFFYADCAFSKRAIDAAAQRNLLQFVSQARLALRLCT